MILELPELEEDFDDDLAKSLLEIHVDKILHGEDILLEKSLYNFDLETPEGIDRLLELLPILDPEILNEVYQEIFPGYPVDTLAPRVARLELRGYLMDYLYDNDSREEGREEEVSGDDRGTGEPDVSETAASNSPEGQGENNVSPDAGLQEDDTTTPPGPGLDEQ